MLETDNNDYVEISRLKGELTEMAQTLQVQAE